jgi:hypothetical protein
MKTTYIIFVLFFGVALGCGQDVPEPYTNCDCKGLPTSVAYQNTEGLVVFPNGIYDSFSISATLPGALATPPPYAICNDSTFVNLVRINKLADSTLVVFDGAIINQKVKCLGNASGIALRITKLKKR